MVVEGLGTVEVDRSLGASAKILLSQASISFMSPWILGLEDRMGIGPASKVL